jgi:hypothetical protein
MFNSPLQYCSVCKQHVALDQSKEECARQQHCIAENCPLSHLFVVPDGSAADLAESDSRTQTKKTT